MKVNELKKALKSAKVKLIVKSERTGIYEDFGAREVRAIKEEFGYPFYGEENSKYMTQLVDEFDNWAGEYEG